MSSISPNFWIKLIFFSLIFIICAFIIYALNILIIPITLGCLIGFLLGPIIEKLEARNISRAMGISIIFSILGTIVTLLFLIFTPVIIDEIKMLQANRDKYKSIAISKYKEIKTKVEKTFPHSVPWEKFEIYMAKKTISISAKWVSKLPKLFAESAETILSFIIIIPLMAFFLLKDGHALKKWIIQFVPNRYFELTTEILHNINCQTGAFIRGQIIDCGINAALVSTLLFIIGLPYALIVGVFAGIANAIPFVGPITAGTLGVTISILSGTPSPWLVIIVFGVAHLIDVMFIYPSTVGHSLDLHELVVIFGIILGGHLGGVIGMLVVIPILGILFRSAHIMFRLLKGYNII